MSFWLGFFLIFFLVVVSSTAILFVTNKMRREKEKYTFRTDEGEEIPLGI